MLIQYTKSEIPGKHPQKVAESKKKHLLQAAPEGTSNKKKRGCHNSNL